MAHTAVDQKVWAAFTPGTAAPYVLPPVGHPISLSVRYFNINSCTERTRLANPNFRSRSCATSSVLYGSNSLHDILEETGGSSRTSSLTLPIREGIHEQNIHIALDQRVGSTIMVLVPTVCGSDLECRDGLLCILDLLEELVAGEVSTIHSLGADSDGVNLIGILRSVFYHSSFVCCV